MAAIYSIVAAIVVLAIGAILKDDILTLPAFLIGIMAIACTGQVILDVKRHPHHRFQNFSYSLFVFVLRLQKQKRYFIN